MRELLRLIVAQIDRWLDARARRRAYHQAEESYLRLIFPNRGTDNERQ